MCSSNRSPCKNGNLEQWKILCFLVWDSRHLSLERILILEPSYSVSVTHIQLHIIILTSVVQCQLWLKIQYWMRKTDLGWLWACVPQCWLQPHRNCWTPVNSDSHKCAVLTLQICFSVKSSIVLCLRPWEFSPSEKNNLPDVLISPVRLWFYIRRIF